MTKIIDWRERPPYGCFLGGSNYPDGSEPEVKDVISLMTELNVVLGVAPFRKGMDNNDG